MQLLWFLPSIAYGVMLAFTSGSYLLLISTLLSAILMLLVRWRISLQPKLGPDTQLRVLGKRIWLDDYRLPNGSAFWSREQFDFVYQKLAPQTSLVSEMVEKFVSRNFTKPKSMSAVIGFDLEALITVSLSNENSHGILIGATGSGKTEFLRSWIRALRDSTPNSEFLLIDFKGGAGLAQFENENSKLVTDLNLDSANDAFEYLKVQLRNRESMHPLIVVVDELTHLLQEVRVAESVLSSIAARGRSAHIHLIVTNQNLVGIPRALLSNLRLRILIGQHDPVDAALLGQLAKPQASPEVGYRITQAQLIGHGQPGRQFWFTGFRPERLPASVPEVSAPQRLQHWSPDRREHSTRGQVNRRHGRRRANRGWPMLARKAGSHSLAHK
jgi:hypothetical protein